MSEPSREHVEAVACVVDPAAFRHVSQAWEAQRGVALLAAETILTSTDPAVHAAMLDALVRAGYVYKAKQLAIVAVELAAASQFSPQDALETFVQAMQEVVTHAHD